MKWVDEKITFINFREGIMKILVFLFLVISLQCFAQDSTATYDPCKDPQLLKLEQKDSLSSSEMTWYVQLRQLCEQSRNRVESNEIIKDSQENVSTVLTAFSVYYILAGIGLLVSLIFLLSI